MHSIYRAKFTVYVNAHCVLRKALLQSRKFYSKMLTKESSGLGHTYSESTTHASTMMLKVTQLLPDVSPSWDRHLRLRSNCLEEMLHRRKCALGLRLSGTGDVTALLRPVRPSGCIMELSLEADRS